MRTATLLMASLSNTVDRPSEVKVGPPKASTSPVGLIRKTSRRRAVIRLAPFTAFPPTTKKLSLVT